MAGPGPAAAEATTTSALVPSLPWEPEQGTHILGSYPDALTNPDLLHNPPKDYIRFSSTPVFRTKFHLSVAAAADGAHLVATSDTTSYEKDDPWFTDLILGTPDGTGQLKITGAREQNATELGVVLVAATAPSTVYTLSYRPVLSDGSMGPWHDYCDGSGDAIALLGRYDAMRTHLRSDTISFACPDAISQKCVFWGYGPGNGGVLSRGWVHHQTCTLMGNAEYCMDGRSFTREETPILIRDSVKDYGNEDKTMFGHPTTQPGLPDSWPGDPDTFYIEAGWNTNGPICLSRLRWASLSPNQCSVLKDPRFSTDPEARFCDQWSIPELFANGAILVNGSKMMDAPLHRWRVGSSGDEVSTIRGFFVDRNPRDGVADSDSIFPFADRSGFSPYQTHVGSDGMLLRNLPGTLNTTQMRALYMQSLTAGGDRHISGAGPGRDDPSFEGYSFLDQATVTSEGITLAGLRPFNECTWSGTDHDTRLDGTAASAPCATGNSLSYAFPAP